MMQVPADSDPRGWCPLLQRVSITGCQALGERRKGVPLDKSEGSAKGIMLLADAQVLLFFAEEVEDRGSPSQSRPNLKRGDSARLVAPAS